MLMSVNKHKKKNINMPTFLDIPSPIDLKNPTDALQWAEEANVKRPYRQHFFDFYANELVQPTKYDYAVLEIASGPGFVAEALLRQHPQLDYTALDFSAAMHQLAQQRLNLFNNPQIQFVVADFKQTNWYMTLNAQKYDVIIIHQALHELRHKNHATNFHHLIATHLLKTKGCYAICDHLAQPDGNMQNNELYMTRQEHLNALTEASFQHIDQGLCLEGLQLFIAQK